MKGYEIFLTEEDMMVRDMMRKFVDKEIMPVRQQIDDDHEHKIVNKILQGLVNVGYFKGPFPEEVGGNGSASVIQLCLTNEELSRGDAGICVAAACTSWPWMPAIWANNRTMIEKFGKEFCGNELKIGCFNMTEPGGSHGGGGCDIENINLHGTKIRTSAKQNGNEWVLNGQKMWATNSGIADLYCMVCTTDPKAGDEGIALIYVPKDTPGLSFGKFEKKAGMAADRNCATYMEDVRVPLEYRAAGPGVDAELLHANLTVARVASAAQAVGNAQGIFERVLEYTGERIVANKPIRQHSIAAGMLADMAIGIETARAYYLSAAYICEHPEKYGPVSAPFVLSRCSIAKVYAADMAVMVANKAMELMGSYGYVRDYDVEKYWRDGKMIQLWEGGAQLGRFDVCRGYYDLNL